ncbi:MAG: hypothetical protein GAK43_02653 [Stenotrophomonas maltophilia]|nr:MAG: hypothetical protein GAK43_02653 [Stenotrophomonas maltophilia]
MAAEYLLAVYAAFQAGVGEEGLGHWGQQCDQAFGALALGVVVAVLGDIQLLADIGGEGAPALGQGLHGQQHAAYVGVREDRVCRPLRCLRAARRAALQALAGVGNRRLVGHRSAAQALDADGEAFVVHHGEHRRQALVHLADQPALGAVEVHHAGGRGLDAHLVFHRAAGHRVARPEAAVGLDQQLGHQEHRDAARAGRRVGQLGQHQVDDVLGEVLFAAADEDLGAGDAVAAVGLGLGAGTDQPQVSAGVRLGQAHGAGPAPTVHGRKVTLADLFAGVGIQCQAGAGRQGGVQGEAGVGRIHHLFELHREHLRHAHAAQRGIAGQSDPAALGIGGVGLTEAGGGGHHTVLPVHAFLVAAAIERGQEAGGDARGFFEDGVGSVRVDVFGQCR